MNIKRLRELLSYDPISGILRWKLRRGRMAPAGSIAGSITSTGYISIKIDGEKVPAHKAAWAIYHNKLPPKIMDHRNGMKSDNRIANLRPATKCDNNRNVGLRCDNSSGHKGVSRAWREGVWRVQVMRDGKPAYSGYFYDLTEAATVAKQQREMIHGEFARHE